MSPKDQTTLAEPCRLSLDELKRLSDESLMTHLQAGHADVLAIIFDRYYRLVLSVAMKILRDVGEAEDLMQTVFLEIFKSAAQFDPYRGTLKVWILQYAYHRGMSRRQHLSIRNFYKNSDIAELQGQLLPTEVTHFNDQEIRYLVKQALGSLNETQSRVLKLTYFEGLSLREIAERTDDSLGNVRHHYYRGLNRLRELVKREPAKQNLRFEKQEQADANA
ncbi:MAG: sigma-70 family RNA polymerase sigma factor [Acidobacteriia bacterium]|nr:sigma-70 family RNA polymerase sigma factor [Terriglobia bacterium]